MLFKYTFKYIIVGDYNTGKTAITERFINNQYDNKYISTIGVDYQTKIITIDDIGIKVCLWDTSGQERFRSITESYFKNITCAILTFDLTNYQTFYNLEYWLKKIREDVKNIEVILIGTKLDNYSNYIVQETEINNFIKKNKLSYFKTSSKNNINIDEIFYYSASLILNKIKDKSITPNQFLDCGIRDTEEDINNIINCNNNKSSQKNCCIIL